MILLLEGTEGVGKTTLGHAVSQALAIPYYHFNAPPVEGTFEHFYGLLRDVIAETPNMVIDRFHLSNWAYNGRFGGGVLTCREWRQLDDLLVEQEAYLALMVDSVFAIEERLQVRGDPFAALIDRAMLAAVQTRFQDLLACTRIADNGSYRLPQLYNGTAFTEQGESLLMWLEGRRK